MFEQIKQLIEAHDTIIIHRHKNPDGDALGSQVGLKEILRDYPEEFRLFKSGSPDFEPPEGESAGRFLERAEKFMEMLLREHAGKKILCVSHGGFIKQTLKVVLGFQTFRCLPACENTAVCRYAAKEGNIWQLVSWNDASHLKSFNRSTGW